MPLPNNANINQILNNLESFGAVNQKTELASVIGSPTTSSTSVAQQILNLQTAKNLLTYNLNQKDVAAVNTEPIQTLASKVGDIQVGGSVQGASNSSGSRITFTLRNTTTYTSYHLTVSGLNFKPKKIIIFTSVPADNQIVEYDEEIFGINDFIRAYSISVGTGNQVVSNVIPSASGAYINNTGFRLPVVLPNTEFSWIAYK